jgi:hypothetical protein
MRTIFTGASPRSLALLFVLPLVVGTACTTIDLSIIEGSSCCKCGCGTGGADSTDGAGGGEDSTVSVSSSSSTGSGCLMEGEGCGAKPKLDSPKYAPFGQVAVTTHAGPGNVLEIIDISGAPPPPNVSYPAPIYRDPTWTQSTMGSIFGLTLDASGSIYTTATNIYGVGVPAPGTIWKIGSTGTPAQFAVLPDKGPALGNINYSCSYKRFYV